MDIALKKYLIFFLFVLTSFCFAQKEAANWYFSNKSAVTFLNNPPQALSDSAMNTVEACASISDSFGNLLFYTNGVNVWDKNHTIMPNGKGLLGFESTSQTVIVPKPKDNKSYYIFSIDDLSRKNGLNYSEVNIDLNGGNGDITNLKNISISDKDIAEQITVVKHEDESSFWIVVREVETNNFLAYLVNETGVAMSPVISSVGDVLSNNWGYMKISPNANKLALIGFTSTGTIEVGAVYLYDFDNSFGVLTNSIKLNEFKNEIPYGVEFSSYANKLYVSSTKTTTNSKVYQFNLELSDEEISEFFEIVYEGNNGVFAMQLAIDEKIYLVNYNENYLDVINSPNLTGSDCLYQSKGLNLLSGICEYGLPTLIQSYLKPLIQVENFCLGTEAKFEVTSNFDIASVNWDFGDAIKSSELNPVHIYSNEGTYSVKVIITLNNGEIKEITKDLKIFSSPFAGLTNDVILCSGGSYNLNNKNDLILDGQSPKDNKVAYFGSIENLENHIDPIPLTEIFYLENRHIYAKVYNNLNRNCYEISEFDVVVDFSPSIQVNDYFVCVDDFDEDNFLNFEDFDIKIISDKSSIDITYYQSLDDAEIKTNEIIGGIEISETITPIYVRVDNTENELCYEIAPINIQAALHPKITNLSDLILCDDALNDGKTFFDFSLKDEEIINGQLGIFNVSYHLSMEDANEGVNNIVGSYENISNPQIIYTRIENTINKACYSTSSFLANVVDKPFFGVEETYYLCEGGILKLEIDDGFDAYLWSTGEHTNAITIDKPGRYSVTASLIYNLSSVIECTLTRDINVITSSKASINEITIEDWSQNNSALVLVTGIGEYEYSVDNINFQESNFFENLKAGYNTIYVKDKYGCGVIQEQVLILNYPKYFTPNQDGYNDSWNLNLELQNLGLKVLIFNRYGKLIKELSSFSKGWDGTFNGVPLPESDYWFKLYVEEREEIYYGHFTLKR